MGHKIQKVIPFSIADQLEIEAGDRLLRINGKKIKDIFDYQFYIHEEYIVLLIEKPNKEQWELEIEKEEGEDIGLEFAESLMDQYQSCRNKCMFCFIDQMPPGMRETLYFKDDDARLSFLQGNYITLTNMSEEDIDRIILYKLSPINISVHTTNKELRCQMLSNRFAGDVLSKIKRLYEGKIEMNSQIVLCKGYNDKIELEHTIEDLSMYYPYMKSLSVVPVGLTKYRKGLTALEKFTKSDAIEVLDLIERWQEKLYKKYGTRFVHASDEWYLTANRPIPQEEYYEGYGQIENGVGMVRSFIDEVEEALSFIQTDEKVRNVSLVTGVLAAPILEEMLKKIKEKFRCLNFQVYGIKNEFFGEDITVAGLLTGQDIIKQLQGKWLGDVLLLPSVLLRSKEDVLLDDKRVSDIQNALQIPIRIVQSDGASFVENVLKEKSSDLGRTLD